jgi:ribosomal protein S27AE
MDLGYHAFRCPNCGKVSHLALYSTQLGPGRDEDLPTKHPICPKCGTGQNWQPREMRNRIAMPLNDGDQFGQCPACMEGWERHGDAFTCDHCGYSVSLIAAPKLLRILRELVAEFEYLSKEYDYEREQDGWDAVGESETAEEARAVIREATGINGE